MRVDMDKGEAEFWVDEHKLPYTAKNIHGLVRPFAMVYMLDEPVKVELVGFKKITSASI